MHIAMHQAEAIGNNANDAFQHSLYDAAHNCAPCVEMDYLIKGLRVNAPFDAVHFVGCALRTRMVGCELIDGHR
jgi:hypothetical protein